MDVTYDKVGRMNYHPELHCKHRTPWLVEDQKYLIENYESMGPEEISLVLERTPNTIMKRVGELREQGLMPKPAKRKHHHRMGKQASCL